MKKIIFISVLCFLPCSYSFGQKNLKPKTQEEITAVFCHTWRLVALEMGKMRLPPPLKTDFVLLELKNDGTCIKTLSGEEIQGKWKYDPKYMVLHIEDKKSSIMYSLMTLTENEFSYLVKTDGYRSNMVMQKVNE